MPHEVSQNGNSSTSADDLASATTPTSGEPVDGDAPEPAISIPDSGDTGEGGKLRMIVGLLKKALGVKDIAAMRLSLPASLLEPIPNLEYWCYLDRPDLFIAINESLDPFERLLALLRFLFSKDIKFIHGKVCKPYNSVLGEFFLAHWDVIPVHYPSDDRTLPPIQHLFLLTPPKEEVTSATTSTPSTPSIESSSKSKSKKSQALNRIGKYPPDPTLSVVEQNLAAGISDISLAAPSERSLIEKNSLNSDSSSVQLLEASRERVLFLTEQISHHPPISAFHYSVPARGISAGGIDQISAKVSGTTVKISPGSANKGIFVRIDEGNGKGERYRITHPTASVNGLLTGRFYATVGDSTIVSIEGGENWRVVLEYKEEGWFGQPKFLLEGIVHKIDPDSRTHESWTKVKHVPADKIIARLSGSWRSEIRYKKEGDEDWKTLIDITTLAQVPKTVRPLSTQKQNESRKLWDGVTSALLKKEYSEATRLKQGIEQAQRDVAAGRKRKGETFVPLYFSPDIESGEPTLTQAGKDLLEQEQRS